MPNKLPWFTHDHNAREDEFLQASMDKFGHFGYAAYFMILELIHQHGIAGIIELPLFRLASQLRSTPVRVKLWLEHSQAAGKLQVGWSQPAVGLQSGCSRAAASLETDSCRAVVRLENKKFIERNKNLKRGSVAKVYGSGNGEHLHKERHKEVQTTTNNDSCAEPITALDSAPKEPPLMVFPTRGAHREWPLVKSKAVEWEKSFPGLSVPEQMKLARQWLRDNPGRQKTARGMTRFLYAWLSRRCDGR